MTNEQEQNQNNQEQTIHDRNFDKWLKALPEEKIDDINYWFYSDLRQSNGLLVEFDMFLYEAWHFMTLEGQEFLELKKERECVCNDCAEEMGEIDADNKYHNGFIRWKISNKSLMYDLYSCFYAILLDDDGDLMDFGEFMFGIWRFNTLEGKDFQIESEKETIEEHKAA